ncbi:MAG: redoxin domain-containing protein [Planctomycetes bacterium]|nr:redoxin domain-containing protein [Planctomycetota bacterium]
MIRCLSTALPFLFAAALTASAAAQKLEKGAPAPEIAGVNWHNAPKGEPPTLESLRGQVLLLEFWGTWCAPCVRAMPRIQQLHERYAERGVTVLALSYETPEVLEPFLKKHRYTFQSGSDPEKQVIEAYGISGWPTSVVIDAEGKVFHVGTPYDAEHVLRAALGLERDAGVLLTRALDVAGDKNAEATREALLELQQVAEASFDLAAWAKESGALALAKAPAEAPSPSEALSACAKAWGKTPKERQAALDLLGHVATTEFDLAGWTIEFYGATYPLAEKELRAMLTAERYAQLAAALVTRKPNAELVAKAAEHAGFRSFAAERAPAARQLARKAILAREWPFANKQPKENEAFWSDLSVSGAATSPDKKRIVGILLDGTMVSAAGIDAFVQRELGIALLLESLQGSKPLSGKALATEVKKVEQELLKAARAKYGA